MFFSMLSLSSSSFSFVFLQMPSSDSISIFRSSPAFSDSLSFSRPLIFLFVSAISSSILFCSFSSPAAVFSASSSRFPFSSCSAASISLPRTASCSLDSSSPSSCASFAGLSSMLSISSRVRAFRLFMHSSTADAYSFSPSISFSFFISMSSAFFSISAPAIEDIISHAPAALMFPLSSSRLDPTDGISPDLAMDVVLPGNSESATASSV